MPTTSRACACWWRVTLASDHLSILEVGDGEQAWQLLKRHHPAVALLDVRMPGRTGLEPTRAIRADPDLAGSRVILLTSSAGTADMAAGLAAGADVYLSKPFPPLELLAVVARALGRA